MVVFKAAPDNADVQSGLRPTLLYSLTALGSAGTAFGLLLLNVASSYSSLSGQALSMLAGKTLN